MATAVIASLVFYGIPLHEPHLPPQITDTPLSHNHPTQQAPINPEAFSSERTLQNAPTAAPYPALPTNQTPQRTHRHHEPSPSADARETPLPQGQTNTLKSKSLKMRTTSVNTRFTMKALRNSKTPSMNSKRTSRPSSPLKIKRPGTSWPESKKSNGAKTVATSKPSRAKSLNLKKRAFRKKDACGKVGHERLYPPPYPPTSCFLSCEGIEGAGKTTQVQQLKTYLESTGHQVTVFREPGEPRLERGSGNPSCNARAPSLPLPKPTSLPLQGRNSWLKKPSPCCKNPSKRWCWIAITTPR